MKDCKFFRSDGYGSVFFKDVLFIVGEEVTEVVTEFFSTGKIIK